MIKRHLICVIARLVICAGKDGCSLMGCRSFHGLILLSVKIPCRAILIAHPLVLQATRIRPNIKFILLLFYHAHELLVANAASRVSAFKQH
uniref:hypothetical protein n=1 Tax=Pandoraea sputorum TaxID=93222 RepID=UPI0035568CD4